MRIAIAGLLTKKITPHPLGGTEEFTYLLVKGLVEKGHDVTLYCAKGSKTAAQRHVEVYDTEEVMKFISNVEFVYPYTLLEIKQIMADIKKNEFDILHVNFLKTFLFSFFADQIHIPVIHTIHRDFMSTPAIFEMYKRIGFHDNEHFVFVSKNAFNHSLLKQQTQFIYNGIPLEEFPFTDTRGQESLLWLSRIDPLKGPKEAILAAKGAGIDLILSGDIDREKYQGYFDKEISPLLTYDITFIKPPVFEDKVRLYQQAKALLFPIQWEEPFGLVMVEAMACGTPVIVYNRGSAAELIKDGVTGFIIDPDDVDRPGKGSWLIKKQGIEGLVEAIKRIGEIDRRACRKHVEEYFTVEKMVTGYQALYKSVLEK